MLLAGLSVPLILALVVIGLPIGFVLFIVGFLGLWYGMGFDFAKIVTAINPYSVVAQEPLTVLPLFILTGTLVAASGMTSRAFDTANKWFGRLPGGLAITTIAASALFAATTGSSAACAATVGKIALPEMRKRHYSAWLAAGVTASGGLLGIMIPPSIPLVIYGWLTETSIGKCLIAGVIPGLLTASVYMVGLFFLSLLRPQDLGKGDHFSWRERIASTPQVWGIVLLFVVVIGGIFLGIFTPPEAAAAGAVVAIVLLFMRLKRGSRQAIAGALREAATTSCMILFIMIGAIVYAAFIALSGVADQLVGAIMGIGWSGLGIIVLIMLMYVPLGMFMEPMSMALVTLPLVFPIITALGFDPVWFGVLIVSVWELALITPPVGANVFVIHGLFPEIPLEEVFKGVGLFIFFQLVVLAILIAFPILATWLPNMIVRR